MSKKNYPMPSITGDVIVYDVFYQKILLIKRKKDPFANTWAIVGGFFNAETHDEGVQDASVEAAAIRELKEETNIDLAQITPLGGCTFRFLTLQDAPGRDPRGRVVTAVYTLRITSGQVMDKIRVEAKPLDDAEDMKWFSIFELVEEDKIPLAFDHRDSIRQLFYQEFGGRPWLTKK